jgi:hypothetical protein
MNKISRNNQSDINADKENLRRKIFAMKVFGNLGKTLLQKLINNSWFVGVHIGENKVRILSDLHSVNVEMKEHGEKLTKKLFIQDYILVEEAVGKFKQKIEEVVDNKDFSLHEILENGITGNDGEAFENVVKEVGTEKSLKVGKVEEKLKRALLNKESEQKEKIPFMFYSELDDEVKHMLGNTAKELYNFIIERVFEKMVDLIEKEKGLSFKQNTEEVQKILKSRIKKTYEAGIFSRYEKNMLNRLVKGFKIVGDEDGSGGGGSSVAAPVGIERGTDEASVKKEKEILNDLIEEAMEDAISKGIVRTKEEKEPKKNPKHTPSTLDL